MRNSICACFLTGPRRRSCTALLAAASLLLAAFVFAHPNAAGDDLPAVPAVHSNITASADGALMFRASNGTTYAARERAPEWTVAQLRGNPTGTARGVALDFRKPGFNGTLVFGLIPYGDTRHPQPVYRTTTPIRDGKAEIDIKGPLSGSYDMVGWQQSGSGVVGYRVMAQDGSMLYDGRLRFKGTGPFIVDATLLSGPFVANITDTSAVVWFDLDRALPCSVRVGTGKTIGCAEGAKHQEILLTGLAPDTEYKYFVRYGAYEEHYGFRTAPRPGSRARFTFAYASDSRGGQGGGDRNFLGPNAYIVRRLMAVALDRRARFVQFTGDLVSGYVNVPDALVTQLTNWKQAVEPYVHWMPVYTTVGNHEAVLRDFVAEGGRQVRIPRFPFESQSTEATFRGEFVNPTNGPDSEDGASYDPNPSAADFPSYKENVYSYTYGNVAVVVLNSDYWFAPTISQAPEAGGNLHAYVMDNQLQWLGRTLDGLERNRTIDHVFLTLHTPIFPNGGHVGDDMWYGGNNGPRPHIAGKPVAKGIIERRDDILRLIQSHGKVLAVLTGDEHNYNRLRLGPAVEIYPKGWDKPKVPLNRVFYQVNNGAAGAPYYAQAQTPWTPHVSGFSTQNALCLFTVAGPRVTLEVVNPETLEVIDRAVLR